MLTSAASSRVRGAGLLAVRQCGEPVEQQDEDGGTASHAPAVVVGETAAAGATPAPAEAPEQEQELPGLPELRRQLQGLAPEAALAHIAGLPAAAPPPPDVRPSSLDTRQKVDEVLGRMRQLQQAGEQLLAGAAAGASAEARCRTVRGEFGALSLTVQLGRRHLAVARAQAQADERRGPSEAALARLARLKQLSAEGAALLGEQGRLMLPPSPASLITSAIEAVAESQAELAPAQQQPARHGWRHWQPFRRWPLRRWIFRWRRGGGGKREAPAARLFPCELCDGGACQQLLAVGSKQFNLGPVLPLARLYDFSLHASHRQAAASALAAEAAWRALDPPPPLAPRGPAVPADVLVRRSTDIDTTLTVVASRNLPVALVSREYRRILRRRLQHVGGSTDDPALQTILAAFRVDRLPRSIMAGSSVRKGTTLEFRMGADGSIVARADGQTLAAVRSADLVAAVKHLYIGASPVDKRAAATAVARLGEWVRGGERGPLPAACCELRRFVRSLPA
eukprot:scaffold17.g590.t1